jgi:hypothetical protein
MRPEIDSLPSSEYGLWTAGIGEHFFKRGLGSAATYLAFDEAAADQVGRSFGCVASDFVAAVAAVIDIDADNPFFDAELHECEEEFPCLGILAAQVYVATGMGSFANSDPSAYWTPFRELFTNGRVFRQKALERLEQLWTEARDFYESRSRGRLAIQSDPLNTPHKGWRYVNLPLWQALLRESDRTQIRQWLRDRRNPASDSTKLLRDLVADADHFNRKLAQTLHDASRNATLAAALEELLAELAATVPAHGTPNARRSPGRLRLVGRPALSCFLQRRATIDDWVDATAALETQEIREGITDELSGATWRGDDRILFVDGGPFVGYVTSQRGAVPPGITVTLLFAEDDQAVAEHVNTADSRPAELDERLDGLRAVQVSALAVDESLLALFDCRLASDRPVWLEGGLCYRGRYLLTNPPRVHVASTSSAMLNSSAQQIGADGCMILPTPLVPGHYEISVGQTTLHFDLDDGSALADSTEGEEICIALSRTGIMTTTRVDSLPTKAYLVGAYLGSAP